jgi:hypothetical protein
MAIIPTAVRGAPPALWARVVLAAYLVINGLLHNIAVVWKARAGTLPEGANVPSLLPIGAALRVAGAGIARSLGLKQAMRERCGRGFRVHPFDADLPPRPIASLR